MLTADADPSTSPITRPLGQYGQLEVDAFCAGCGYNLHGQDVSMDERLGFLVCRCPECGRYHPAGHGTVANSVWMSRYAAMLLVVWIGIVLATAAAATFAMGGLQAAYIGTFTWYQAASGNGQGFSGQWFYTTTPPADANPMSIPGWGSATVLIVASLALGFFVGTLMVAFLWHWARWRYVLGIIMPALAASFAMWIYMSQREYQYVEQWCVSRTWTMAAVQAAGMMLAIRLGRPLARAIVRSIIPPKPRQLLTFLWRVDGKTMPAASA
ncbi:MAG TPA: hypothetical protein VLI90_04100 [Tepidisphaeraceae bacterium]|nr:hypothetical protein [Tepidisphaeraceae bacterium]